MISVESSDVDEGVTDDVTDGDDESEMLKLYPDVCDCCCWSNMLFCKLKKLCGLLKNWL